MVPLRIGATVRRLRRDRLRELNEVVTNAVQHAGTATQVGAVLDGDALAVRVRDFSCHPAASTSQWGLGLRLVDGVAPRWGFETHEDGKTAWAQFTA